MTYPSLHTSSGFTPLLDRRFDDLSAIDDLGRRIAAARTRNKKRFYL